MNDFRPYPAGTRVMVKNHRNLNGKTGWIAELPAARFAICSDNGISEDVYGYRVEGLPIPKRFSFARFWVLEHNQLIPLTDPDAEIEDAVDALESAYAGRATV